MTSLRDAAQQALEALEEYAPQHGNPDDMDAAITALRTAILYPGTEYEQGFIDGMSEQARRSVDRMVNAMAKSREEKE
jgi:hypothetical protein